jgi:hypothetical protein
MHSRSHSLTPTHHTLQAGAGAGEDEAEAPAWHPSPTCTCTEPAITPGPMQEQQHEEEEGEEVDLLSLPGPLRVERELLFALDAFLQDAEDVRMGVLQVSEGGIVESAGEGVLDFVTPLGVDWCFTGG